MTLLLKGDARDVLTIFPDCVVDCCATSPSYWMQRDYGVAGQIGREKAIDQYLHRLWAVFDEVRRVLTPDGTCWVNLGDKYLGKCAQLIPERFAIGMVERGWLLRNKVIWQKKNPKPESTKSRFANDSEPLYFFAKSQGHYFNQQYEECSLETIARCERFVRNGEKFDPLRHKHDVNDSRQASMRLSERIVKGFLAREQMPNGMRRRHMRSVWRLNNGGFHGAHFAVWPPQLVSRIVRAGCPKGGILLDCFVGSGTSLVIAEDEGCTGIGIDLNGDYLEMAAQRVQEARVKRANPKAVSVKIVSGETK